MPAESRNVHRRQSDIDIADAQYALGKVGAQCRPIAKRQRARKYCELLGADYAIPALEFFVILSNSGWSCVA